MQKQLDALDKARVEGEAKSAENRTWSDDIDENEDLKRLCKDKRGSAQLLLKNYTPGGRKTVLTEAGGASFTTPGVLRSDRIPGITIEARQKLKIRELFTSRPTSLPLVDFIKVTLAPNVVSPVTEGSVKPEAAATFAAASERIRLLATLIPATKQIMSDFPELKAYLMEALPYYIDLKEESLALTGDGSGRTFMAFRIKPRRYRPACSVLRRAGRSLISSPVQCNRSTQQTKFRPSGSFSIQMTTTLCG